MKLIFFTLLYLGIYNQCVAQVTYSVVHDSYLHIPIIREHSNDTYIKSINILKKKNEIPTTEINAFVKSPFYDYPFAWYLQDSLIFAVHCIHNKSPELSYFAFFRTKKSNITISERRRRDSLLAVELEEDIPNRDELLAELFQRKEPEIKYKNVRYLYPLTLLFRWKTGLQGRDFHKGPIIDNITFDFIALSSRKFLFYIRDDRQLSIWQYDYPEYGERLDENAWQELITYSRDSIGEYHLPQKSFWYHNPKLKYHPSGKHHQYQSIQDTAFFQGHFKMVKQGTETFCINTDTGFIYHIGEKDIVRVGAVKMKNYPQWLLGKPLFIEDRDAGQLIFLSNVQQTNKDRPFPKTEVLKSRGEVNKRYPGLKGK